MVRTFGDPQTSDVKIKCHGEEFRVHKDVLCSWSVVLAAELKGEFKESGGVIEHKHFDPETVERMLEFFYDKDYTTPDNGSTMESHRSEGTESELADKIEAINITPPARDDRNTTPPTKDALLAHEQVHGIACYYNIPQLKLRAYNNFIPALKRTTWNADDTIELLKAIYQQDTTQNSGLRKAMIDKCLDHSGDLINNDNFKDAVRQDNSLMVFCFDFMARLNSKVKEAELRNVELQQRRWRGGIEE